MENQQYHHTFVASYQRMSKTLTQKSMRILKFFTKMNTRANPGNDPGVLDQTQIDEWYTAIGIKSGKLFIPKKKRVMIW